ncbi:MAG TPA: type IV secretion system protein [Terriglobia bacterium]|nr:type IV secretion system protein [Terriglobia bacterium]
MTADLKPTLRPVVSGNLRRLDTGNDYDRLQRYSRLVTGYAVMMTVGFTFLGGFTWSLFPLKQIVPQFVYFSDARDQVVSVDARHISRDTRDLLAENLIRAYVTDRETINNVDERVRYPRLQRFSAVNVFGSFRKLMDPSSPNSPLKKYRDAGMTRETHIEAVTPTSYREGIYAVDFVVIDRKGPDEVARKTYTASVQVSYKPIETHPDIASENPIGLQVEAYSIRERDLSATSKGTSQ